MNKSNWLKFILIFFIIIILDRVSKFLFLSGWQWHCEAFSLALVFNDGVAFSMLAFLAQYLKYLQILLLLAIWIYLLKEREFLKAHTSAIALIAAGGISNVADRFFYPGVIDFFGWHYGFNFAVFNVADVAINLGVALIFVQILFLKKEKK